MVSSADGAAFLESRTAGLSSPTDIRLFGLLRALADVVLVGAGTVRTEQYKPARRRAALASLRAGRTATPPIALVSRALALDLETPLFTDAPPDARTIVITCAASPADRRAALATWSWTSGREWPRCVTAAWAGCSARAARTCSASWRRPACSTSCA
jgi:riboflavin biosynthesis pyrimidine reductase